MTSPTPAQELRKLAMEATPVVVMQARSQSIEDLVDACARGELPFSGPDSLCAKVAAMGFNTTSLYGAVMAAKSALATIDAGGKL